MPKWAHEEEQQRLHKERIGGANLLNLLLAWYAQRKINAQDLCVACHHCEIANVKGASFARYVSPPGRQSGKYQDSLNRILPGPGPLFVDKVPGVAPGSEERGELSVALSAVWERIEQDVKTNKLLQAEIERSAWPPAYKNHVLVRKAVQEGRPLPYPLGVFADGTVYTSYISSQARTVLGFWIINLITGARYYFGGIRSNEFCRCGCRGWCTVWCVLRALAYALHANASGQRPSRTSSGALLAESDALAIMRNKKGVNLSYTGAVSVMKQDHGEVSHTYGLPCVTSTHHGCPFCTCTKHDMHTMYARAHFGQCPFHCRTADDYEKDCQRLEVDIVLRTPDDLKALVERGQLKYMKGRGYWGRTFMADFARLGVQAKDRLDPSDMLPDVDKLEQLATPCVLKIWRPNYVGGNQIVDPIVHRCPIFVKSLGISPASMGVDDLHSLYKGPVERFNAAVLWRLILNNPWGVTGNEAQRQDLAAKHLRADLFLWQRKVGLEASKKFQDFTLSMCGPQRGATDSDEFPHPGGSLKLKAAENGTLLLWTTDMLERLGSNVPFSKELATVGQSLSAYLDHIRSEPFLVSLQAQQRMFDLMQRSILNAQAAKIDSVPKTHFFYHMTDRMASES